MLSKKIRYTFLVFAVVILFSCCTATKGGIVILDKPEGAGFDIELKAWSDQSKCSLPLDKEDTVRVAFTRESGEVSLGIRGKNGSEPYTGNFRDSIEFTVTVSDSDTYEIQLSGKNATGRLEIAKIQDK